MTDNRILPHDHGECSNLNSIQTILNQSENFQILADIFKQLGDANRIRVFWLLCHMEECVTNVAAMLDMSSPAVSHHLRSLKSSGLIVSRRDGKEVYYHTADSRQSLVLHEMIEQMMEIACPELGSLPESLDHRHLDQ